MKLRVKPIPQESLQRRSILKEAGQTRGCRLHQLNSTDYLLHVKQRKLKGISPATTSSLILENFLTKYFAYIAYDGH